MTIFQNRKTNTSFINLNKIAAGDVSYQKELKRLCVELLLNFKNEYKKLAFDKNIKLLHSLLHKAKFTIFLIGDIYIEKEVAFVINVIEDANRIYMEIDETILLNSTQFIDKLIDQYIQKLNHLLGSKLLF